jgi:hypothetical protein
VSVKEKLGDLPKKVQKLRDGGAHWDAIADELGERSGKCMLAYEFAVVEKSDLITGTDAAVHKAIVAARDKQKQSWAVISARTDLPESKCRAIYDPEGHGRGNRIGKGGRFPSDAERPARTPKAKGEKAAPKAAGKRAPAKTTGVKTEQKKVPIDKMNLDQITARLTGKVIGVQANGDARAKSMKVATVVSLSKAGGELTFEDAKGNEHSVSVKEIVRASA